MGIPVVHNPYAIFHPNIMGYSHGDSIHLTGFLLTQERSCGSKLQLNCNKTWPILEIPGGTFFLMVYEI